MVVDKNLTIEELDVLERSKYLPLTIFLVTIMCVGVVGNSLVVIIYKRKFKRSSARVYILSLACADLTVCVIGIPYHVMDLTWILTYTNISLCKVFSYCIGACTLSSVFILLVVGLDRYLKVCRPLKRQIIDFGDRKACLIAVLVAIVISIPNGIIYGRSAVQTQIHNLTGVECFIDDEYHGSGFAVGYLGFTLLVFALSVIFLIVVYGFICHTIYKQDNSREITLLNSKKICFCCSVEIQDANDDAKDTDLEELNNITTETEDLSSNTKLKTSINRPERKLKSRNTMMRHSRRQGKVGEKNTKKITLVMMTVTLVFIIAYLPFIVISIMDSLDEEFWNDLADIKSLVIDLLLRLYLINNVANPVIYGFWDTHFRKEIIILLRSICCCSKQPKNVSRNYRRGDNASSKLTESTLQ